MPHEDPVTRGDPRRPREKHAFFNQHRVIKDLIAEGIVFGLVSISANQWFDCGNISRTTGPAEARPF